MTSADPTFEGVYGTYSITAADRQEVRFYRLPGVADTCDGSAWRHDYFGALFPLNPSGIVPAGPDLSTLVNSTAASG